jgi:hypothetical protein
VTVSEPDMDPILVAKPIPLDLPERPAPPFLFRRGLKFVAARAFRDAMEVGPALCCPPSAHVPGPPGSPVGVADDPAKATRLLVDRARPSHHLLGCLDLPSQGGREPLSLGPRSFLFLPFGRTQAVDPARGGGKGDPMATPRRLDAEGDREMRLAGAGGPRKTTLLASARKSSVARWAMVWRLTLVWTVKSKSSTVLTAGKWAALTRAAPPWPADGVLRLRLRPRW